MFCRDKNKVDKNEPERVHRVVDQVGVSFYLSTLFSLKFVRLSPVDHLQHKISAIQERTFNISIFKKRNFHFFHFLLTYIQIAIIDIGKAERPVNKRQPCVGVRIIAITYSKILPIDQKTSITITQVARVVDGRYSNINVELNKQIIYLED